MAVVATGEVALRPDLRGFESALGGAITRATAKLGAVVAGAFAGSKVADFFGGAIDQSKLLERAVQRIGFIFGDTAPQVLALGRNSAEAFGLSRRAALDASGQIGALLVSLGLGRQEAAGMAGAVLKLGADLSVTSGSLGGTAKVLDSFTSALIGEFDPIQRLGIAISANSVKQKAAALGFKDMGGAAKKAGKDLDRITDAVERLADTQERANEALASAQERVQSSIAGVATAEERVVDAQQRSLDAQRKLTDAREDARRQLDDLRFAVEENGLSERRAVLRQVEAQRKLGELQRRRRVDSLELAQADLDLREATLGVAGAQRKSKSDQESFNKLQEKGIDSAEGVQDALRGIADSNRAVRDSNRDLVEAQRGVIEAQLEVAKVQKDSAKDIMRAQRDIARSMKESTDAAGDLATGLTPTQQAVATLADIMDKSKIVQGAWDASQETSATKAQILQAKIDDLKASIGDRLQPTYLKFLEFVEQKVLPFVERNIDDFERWAKTIIDVGRDIIDFTKMVKGWIDTIGGWGATIGEMFGLVFRDIRNFINNVIGFVRPALINLIELIPSILRRFVPGLNEALEKLKTDERVSKFQSVPAGQQGPPAPRQHGGPVKPNTWYRTHADEHFSEGGYFMPTKRGYITPASKMSTTEDHRQFNMTIVDSGDPYVTARIASREIARASRR